LLLSVRDVDDQLVVLSLNALATLVPVLGGDVVIGDGRQQLFSRGRPKVNCVDDKHVIIILCTLITAKGGLLCQEV